VLPGEMEQVVPWTQLRALIEPHAPVAKTSRPPFALSAMLRIHFSQRERCHLVSCHANTGAQPLAGPRPARANRSDTQWYREDLRRRPGVSAISCFDIYWPEY